MMNLTHTSDRVDAVRCRDCAYRIRDAAFTGPDGERYMRCRRFPATEVFRDAFYCAHGEREREEKDDA